MVQLFLFRNQNLWLWIRLVPRFWLPKYHPPKWLVFHRKWNVYFPLDRLKIKLLLDLNQSISYAAYDLGILKLTENLHFKIFRIMISNNFGPNYCWLIRRKVRLLCSLPLRRLILFQEIFNCSNFAFEVSKMICFTTC